MIPTNATTPPQQILAPGWTWGSAGLPSQANPVPQYAMQWHLDNWVYFGRTGFPASSTMYQGQPMGPTPAPQQIS